MAMVEKKAWDNIDCNANALRVGGLNMLLHSLDVLLSRCPGMGMVDLQWTYNEVSQKHDCHQSLWKVVFCRNGCLKRIYITCQS